MNGSLLMSIDPKGREAELIILLMYLNGRKIDLLQRQLKIEILINKKQRELLGLQRKRILSETPEEKRIRLLVIKTGLPEDEIRKGLELIGKD